MPVELYHLWKSKEDGYKLGVKRRAPGGGSGLIADLLGVCFLSFSVDLGWWWSCASYVKTQRLLTGKHTYSSTSGYWIVFDVVVQCSTSSNAIDRSQVSIMYKIARVQAASRGVVDPTRSTFRREVAVKGWETDKRRLG